MRDAAHPFITLATEAITTFLSEQRVIVPPAGLFEEVPRAREPAGVFVCLKRAGRLRGCLGTTEPAYGTRAAEIIANAIGAATRDPRFPPVERAEAADLFISVDVLGPCRPIAHPSELDPHRYGLLLCAGRRRSVLLPDLDGVDSVAEQIRAARLKAGIAAEEHVDMFCFEVERYR